jgi:predicted RNA-binding protein YlxR (DUF448 family)/ribosomal protein L30E
MRESTARTSTRTCVGCRQTDTSEALLRFVLAGHPPVLVPDVRRRESARGVSVHPRRSCLTSAVASGALRRGLKADVAPAAVDDIARVARAQYERRAQGLLLAARRVGKLALGEGAAREAMDERRAHLLLVASDAEGSRDAIERGVARLGERGLVFGTKEDLGKLLGRTTLGVLAVCDQGIADALRGVIEAAAGLSEGS